MALTDDLAAYWPLDEASGDAVDAHAANDLTDNNTVGSAAGKVDGARDFEAGNSEYFSRADNADLSTGDIDFTIQAWVQLESKGEDRIVVAKWDTTMDNFEYILFFDADSDRFVFFVNSNGTVGGTFGSVTANNLGAPSTGTWYLIHCWHDSVNNQLGIAANAGSADTAAYSAGVFNGASNFVLGRNDNTGSPVNYWDGLIDEVGLWKRVLSGDERAELYNGGSGLAYPFDGGGGGFVAFPYPRGLYAGMAALDGGVSQ